MPKSLIYNIFILGTSLAYSMAVVGTVLLVYLFVDIYRSQATVKLYRPYIGRMITHPANWGFSPGNARP